MDKVLAALYLLGICCSLGLGAEVNFSLEDEDGSADDEDFSGSGLGVIVPSAFDDVEKEHSEPLAPLAPTAVQDFTENVTALVLVEPTTKSQDGDLQKINEPGLSVEIPAVGPSSHTTTHRPTSTAAVATESSDAFDHHPHHGGHHHHHHHQPKTTTDSKVHQESTTQGQHVHKPHEHHIPDPVVTTSHPKEHHPFQKTTTPGPVKDAGFVYHHVHHHEGSASTPYADKEEATADPTDPDDPALVGFDVNPTTEQSDDLHKLHKQTTAISFLVDGSNVHHVLHGKITTSPPRNDEEDRTEFTTSTPKDADSDVLVHHGGDKTTSPSSHVHHVHQDTTPSGVDKHGRRHHHHHHPHHHTTTASTEQTTGSDEQHGLHTLNPKDSFVVSTTVTNAVVPVVNEDLNIPEDSEPKQTTENSPIERSTHHPEDKDPLVPDENDVDLFDSKEDEVSGDGAEVNNDLFFEKTSSDVKSEAIDRSSAVDGEGSSDASHGIMERKELLAGIIAGGAVGLIFAGFLVGFVLYRMKKKDEGSYSLEEPKQSNGGYQKPREQREFYA